MKLFLRYLKSKIKPILLFACASAVFMLSFVLYRLPFTAVIYPTVLCVLLAAVFVIIDFSAVKKKHDRLCDIRKLSSALLDGLPDEKDIIVSDYADIISALRTEIARATTENDMKLREIADYYTVWAHQIKTPIASMKLTLENEDTQAASKLLSELCRIEQYVSMVMAYIRLDGTSNDFVFRECELNGVICQAVRKFSSEFILRKLTLDYQPTDVTVLTDEKWLSFVLEQIISNALKYTPSGTIAVSVAPGGIITVADTGIGIAKEDIPRVFDKGYTGHNGRSDKSASGIGLYLCKKVCEKLGAAISVRSEVGVGTTVSVDLSHSDIKAE